MYPEAVVGVGSCFLEFVMGVDIYGIVVVYGSSFDNDYKSDVASAWLLVVSFEILTLSGVHELCERTNYANANEQIMRMRTNECNVTTRRMRTILEKGFSKKE